MKKAGEESGHGDIGLRDLFLRAAPTRVLSSSPGKYSGEDNGWVLSLVYPVLIEFDKSIIKYSNITRYVGGASTDLVLNLQNPENPVGFDAVGKITGISLIGMAGD